MMNHLSPCALITCLFFLSLSGQVETIFQDQPDIILVRTDHLDAFQNLEAGNYELALEQFDQLLKEKPNYTSALMGKAKSHLQCRQYQEAYDTYLKVLAKNSSDHYSLEGIGNAALFLDQADIALSYYKRALVFKPSDAQLYEAIAVSQICTNDFRNAAESAKMASLMYNKKGIEAPHSLILAYFSYAEIKDNKSMQQVLSYCQKLNLNYRWPTPIVQYIRGEINAYELISLVQSEKEEIEAHTYIGLKLRLNKQFDESEIHLNWVKDSERNDILETLIAKHILRQS